LSSIRADNPARFYLGSARQSYPSAFDADNGCFPQKLCAQRSGATEHFSMQHRAPQPDAACCWKSSANRRSAVYKVYLAKRKSVAGSDLDPQLSQGGERVRHQALTAGLIDWRLVAVCEDYA
jgi:hypothetical protein